VREPSSGYAHRVDQPSLHDYALIGDRRGAALVSRAGSIDWSCLPRFDQGSCFGRLLDWERGGFCAIEGDGLETRSRYVDGTLVLETELRGRGGVARVLDCMAVRGERRLLRVIEGVEGELELCVRVVARFDYGETRPWLRVQNDGVVRLLGGDDAIVAWCDARLQPCGEHDLEARLTLGAGDRVRLSLAPADPVEVGDGAEAPSAQELDRQLDETLAYWREVSDRAKTDDPAVVRSALTLSALVYEPTGAVIAAPTTSLPEAPRGERNWDYRYSWVRDSTFAARTLSEVGFDDVADGFARFVMRSAGGHADELQVAYGLTGYRRANELDLDLAGYRGARPVRIGNGALSQVQRDELGELMQMCWRWCERGKELDDEEWGFITSVVEQTIEHWSEPDQGFWEWPGDPRHFVHSKAACWGAVDRGLALAEAQGRECPAERWRAARDEIGAALDERGFDRDRGTYVQAFGCRDLDATALLLPVTGYIAYDDERMVSTVDVIRDGLDDHGLLRRYDADDGLPGREGAFLACSFWLVDCLARQGRVDEAREVYERVMETASPLGLFSEEGDARTGEPLGNYPQGLTHLSHIAAALTLVEASSASAAR
jgi:GH15 family glucan-1,4-alpha-glucosidase